MKIAIQSSRTRPFAAIAAILILTTSIGLSGITGFITQQTQNWSFIQSVGGMKISLKGKTLNVDCDVSGTKKVTVEPTMVNSGIAVRQIKHKQVGKTIQLSLVTCVIEKGMSNSWNSLDLSSYPDGEYSVEYRGPDGKTHALGKITLEK